MEGHYWREGRREGGLESAFCHVMLEVPCVLFPTGQLLKQRTILSFILLFVIFIYLFRKSRWRGGLADNDDGYGSLREGV